MKTRKQLLVAAQKYARKYIGSEAAETKVQDEQEWVAEWVEEYDKFLEFANELKVLQLEPLVPE